MANLNLEKMITLSSPEENSFWKLPIVKKIEHPVWFWTNVVMNAATASSVAFTIGLFFILIVLSKNGDGVVFGIPKIIACITFVITTMYLGRQSEFSQVYSHAPFYNGFQTLFRGAKYKIK